MTLKAARDKCLLTSELRYLTQSYLHYIPKCRRNNLLTLFQT